MTSSIHPASEQAGDIKANLSTPSYTSTAQTYPIAISTLTRHFSRLLRINHVLQRAQVSLVTSIARFRGNERRRITDDAVLTPALQQDHRSVPLAEGDRC